MTVPPAAAAELAVVAGSLVTMSVAMIVAARARVAAHAYRETLRLAQAREASFIDAAGRLASAARESVDAVRDEIVRAARAGAREIDGVLLYEEHDGTLRCTVAFGDRFEHFAGTCIALDDGSALPARALSARHRITLADRGVRRLHPHDGAAVAVPLVSDAGCGCALVAASRCALAAETIERLVTLADQASPAYLIALEREHDRRTAEYDGLTGLLTPRAFRRRLSALVERGRFAPASRLALLFVDTDHFKQWNDAHGHAAGDVLLHALADILRSAAPSERDLVARNGGDEFCLVFTETDKSTGVERAEIVRRRIAAIDPRISASIGVAAFPADAANTNDLLERADAAMYHAKQTGRNGVSYCGSGGGFVRLPQELSSEGPFGGVLGILGGEARA
jgi:diguanylate cyclase (GGDEF)-like protein